MKSILIYSLIIGLIASCAPQAQLTVLRPAKLDTTGIKKVAIGPFEIMMADEVAQTERNGVWEQRPLRLSAEQKQALANQIRAQVTAKLAESGYFDLVYTDEYQKLASTEQLEKTIGAAGFKDQEAQAVISGRVWLQLNQTDGAFPKKQELQFVSGGSQSFALSVEKVIWWPYKSMQGTLALELSLIRAVPTQVLAVSTETREFSHRIGGEPLDAIDSITDGMQNLAEGGSKATESKTIEGSDEVLPSFEQTIAELSGSIATNFVRNVSVTETRIPLSIATGGDARAAMLVQAGAYQMAIDRLQKLTATKPNPEDQYNLGLSFEATGEYGLARLSYREALVQGGENPLYARGLGRIEKLMREKPGLRHQLNEKDKQ